MTDEAEAAPEETELTLSDAFNDDEVETEETETTETKATTETEKGEEEDSKGKETEEPESKKVEAPSTETAGLQAALLAERHKRQKAEKKLKSLEEPETVPDPIEDPEGYSEHISAKADKNLLSAKIDLSRDLMMDSKDDYLEKEKVFMGLIGEGNDGEFVVTDQSLHDRFKSSKNPASFAYKHAVKHLDVEAKSAPDYEEKLTARIKAEILAEMDEAGTGKPALKAVDVPDLTKAAAGSNSESVEKEDDLGDIFGDE